MRRLIIPIACLMILGLGAQAQAASAASLLNLDGETVNHLEDQDWENLIVDNNSNGKLDIGDWTLGMIEIQAYRDVYPTGSDFRSPGTGGYPAATITGVFLLEVTGKVLSGGLYTFTFGSAGIDAWTHLQDGTIDTLTNLGTPTHEGTVGMFYDDTSTPYVSPAPPAPDDSLNGALGTATDGNLWWEIGFKGDPGEYWINTTSFDGSSPPPPPAVTIFQVNGLVNVTEWHDGPKLLPHEYLASVATGLFGDVHFTGGLEAPSLDDLKYFSIKTDTDFYILPTPEPGSILLLGLGLAACGGLVYRRRKTRA